MSEAGTDRLPPVAPGAVVAEISMSLDGFVTGPARLGAVQSPLSTHLRYRVVR